MMNKDEWYPRLLTAPHTKRYQMMEPWPKLKNSLRIQPIPFLDFTWDQKVHDVFTGSSAHHICVAVVSNFTSLLQINNKREVCFCVFPQLGPLQSTALWERGGRNLQLFTAMALWTADVKNVSWPLSVNHNQLRSFIASSIPLSKQIMVSGSAG